MNDVPTIAIAFKLNGTTTNINVECRELLIDVLRNQCGLTGSKRSCDVQVCGACTVLVGGMPVSSCTTLAADVDSQDVFTIEGLSNGDELDPIQIAFIKHGAMQCGFCTPGMVLAVKALLHCHPEPTEEVIRHFLRGNICRCTGYSKIIKAVQYIARQMAIGN